jgi:hypothetical protein
MAREDLLRLGAQAKLDSAAAEMLARFSEAGVAAIVLKGSPLADRLYDPSEIRTHDDVDLLLPERGLDPAGSVLRDAGFGQASDHGYAQDWIREADGVTIDIHVTLVGVGVAPSAAWESLAAHTRTSTIGGVEATVFDDAALAFHSALHAAQHGAKAGKALEDLRRAAERIDLAAWTRAAQLAHALDATDAFGVGLRLLPEGSAIADRLELPRLSPAAVMLRASSPPPTTLGLQRLAATPGTGAKLRLLAEELAPSPTFMRAIYPIARRGGAGLVAAYAWRPLWLAWHALPALRAWRRAERASRRVSRPRR